MVQRMVNESITAEAIAAIAVTAMAAWQRADQDNRDTEREIFANRIAGLEVEASFYTPKTPEAALYQIGVARGQVSTIEANYIDDNAGRELFHNIDRLLVQITRYVEATSGVTRAQAGLLYYSDPENEGNSFGKAGRS